MNESNPPSVVPSKPTRSSVKVSFPMDRELHDQIVSALTEVSTQLGFGITLPKFLRKTVAEGWKVQIERYRKLDATLRKRGA